MATAFDVLVNANSATVAAGSGNTAPSALTVETWTVTTGSVNWPVVNAASFTQFRVLDLADLGKTSGYELILVTISTNGTNQTWTVTRGVEGTTPAAHGASAWTIVPEITAAGLVNNQAAAAAAPLYLAATFR